MLWYCLDQDKWIKNDQPIWYPLHTNLYLYTVVLTLSVHYEISKPIPLTWFRTLTRCTINVSTTVLYRTVEHKFVWLQIKNLLKIFLSSHNSNSQVRNSNAYWSRQKIYHRFSFFKCDLQSIIYLHCTWFDDTCQRFLNVFIWLYTKQLQQWKLNAI